MGTTSTSGWALFCFLLGFTILGTSGIGGGVLAFLAGAGVMTFSAVLFRQARLKEEK